MPFFNEKSVREISFSKIVEKDNKAYGTLEKVEGTTHLKGGFFIC
ncbi:MAG: hypothetical protein N2746_10200 [Deltaproteobacteria bacterium]|nr:hypothetical protein [Deltaproteobacteria bacterium]